jgi:hypothetical protein
MANIQMIPGDSNTTRCKAEHNPGVWPYVARCVRPLGHPGDWGVRDDPLDPATFRLATPTEHYDQHGRIWED